MSTNCPKLKNSNRFFFLLHQLLWKALSLREGDSLGSLGMKEISYMPSVKKKCSMCSTSFFRKSGKWLSPTTDHVSAPYIMKMIEKVSKKTFM
jgi:hypothetical protein